MISDVRRCFLAAFIVLPLLSAAQDSVLERNDHTPRVNLHFQTTYIYQYKPEFSAKYSGTNSLISKEEKQNSLTSTLYLGVRLWKGAEVYINPELAGGSGLSGAFGLGASSNGETFRVGNPEPTLYLGRGYFTQTFTLRRGGYTEVAEGANELGGPKPVRYLKLYLGKLSLGDIFDNNAYANSPRTQFMNWCLMNDGAWDYAANVRGYTYALAAVLQLNRMSYRAALATLPTTANGPDLNTDLSEEYSLNAEVSRTHTINGRAGTVRLLVYHNSGHMGNYRNAIQNATATAHPDVTATRQFGRTKTGFSLNADQQLSDVVGLFARVGYNDGINETWAFTEVDKLVSAGVSVSGDKWRRKNDVLALAVDMNGLSKDHSDYLAAGGYGFQLGDGTLTYANETAIEAYYSCKPFGQDIWFTADYQFLMNPGYNKDRGPVNVFSFRLHVEL